MLLTELTSLIRSKNAGPFSLTFDIMCSDEASYQRVKGSGRLNAEFVARLYGCPVGNVRYFECDNALAFKLSMPRPIPAGDLGDGDLHGGQQFAPFMAIEIP